MKSPTKENNNILGDFWTWWYENGVRCAATINSYNLKDFGMGSDKVYYTVSCMDTEEVQVLYY